MSAPRLRAPRGARRGKVGFLGNPVIEAAAGRPSGRRHCIAAGVRGQQPLQLIQGTRFSQETPGLCRLKLTGALPPPLRHPPIQDYAILPAHKIAFCFFPVIPRHLKRPPTPNGGRAGAMGEMLSNRRISYENRSLPDLIMGWKSPNPPLRWMPPPRRTPRGGLNYRISLKPNLPREGP